MELRVGTKYRLSKKIGGGSFGDIFHGGFRDSGAFLHAVGCGSTFLVYFGPVLLMERTFLQLH